MKKETFTYEVKEEIVSYEYSKEELLPILSGFIKVNGVIAIREKKRFLTLKTENSKIAKLIYNSFKDCFNIVPSFSYSKKMKLNKNVVYHIIIQEKIDYVLQTLELSDGIFSIFPKNLVLGDNLKFFLSGIFLASGTINSPMSDNYHLQITFLEEDTAKYVLKLLNRYRNDKSMDFKMITRKNKYIIYLKKADQITTFLTIIGAPKKMFEFENSRIEKDFINSENRLTICFTANYQKTLKKSMEQIKDIELLKLKYQDVSLNEKENAVMELRMKYPEAPLKQISELLLSEYSIKVSKSGVNHIFKTIHEKADKLRD